MASIALQSAASGMCALNTAMDVISNNLANISTAGFKASRANFEDLLYIQEQQPGVRNINNDQRPIGLSVGLGVRVSGTQNNFEQGSPIKGGKLDLMIQGEGFFQVRVPDSQAPGGIAYTRDGQFTLNSEGQVVMATNQGQILEPTIVIDGEVLDVSIDASGQVYVTRPNQVDPELVGQIQLANFVNVSGLQQTGSNLFIETAASGPPIQGNPTEQAFGSIVQGYFEASNVDPTTELINLIRVQRAFEMNSNTIRAADQVLQTVAQLRR